MFDLITGRERHLPSHPTAPILLSTFAQATLIAVIALIPVTCSYRSGLPDVPDDDGVRGEISTTRPGRQGYGESAPNHIAVSRSHCRHSRL